MSVNKATILGNLGRDPEIRMSQSGARIANLNLATSEKWKDKATGEQKEHTEWHRVVIFSEPLVDVAEKYLKKGNKVYIEGQLRTRKWTDQGGVEKYTTEIVLQGFNCKIDLIDRPSNAPPPADDPSQYGTQSSTRPGVAPRGSSVKPANEMDDDIPF